MDSQIACDKYLENGRVPQLKILETNVIKTLEILDSLKPELQTDHKRDNYKLHMLVPVQAYYMGKDYQERKE